VIDRTARVSVIIYKHDPKRKRRAKLEWNDPSFSKYKDNEVLEFSDTDRVILNYYAN